MQRRLIGLKAEASLADLGVQHLWDSKNSSVDGSGIYTQLDTGIVGGQTITNPTSSNAPSFNSADSDFNNKPVFDYDGIDDYFDKSDPSVLEGYSSGAITAVVNVNNVSNNGVFAICQPGVLRCCGFRISSRAVQIYNLGTDTGNHLMTSSTLINTLETAVVTVASTGTEYKIIINGVESSFSASGTNDGAWMSDFGAGLLNTVILGNIKVTVEIPFDGKIGEVAISEWRNLAYQQEIHSFLMSKYNI